MVARAIVAVDDMFRHFRSRLGGKVFDDTVAGAPWTVAALGHRSMRCSSRRSMGSGWWRWWPGWPGCPPAFFFLRDFFPVGAEALRRGVIPPDGVAADWAA